MDGCSTQLAREEARLEALCRYDLLDTAPEEGFDDLTRLAAQICGTPIALISLIDCRRQWFKSRIGLDIHQTARDVAFCRDALHQSPDLLLVPDALRDSRFAENSLVTGPPFVRAYAGAPLVTSDGHILGTLCVMDTRVRTFSDGQLTALQSLSRQAMAQMELRRWISEGERSKQERARSAELLRQSEEQYRLLFDTHPSPMWVYDIETLRVVAVNNAAAANYGYTREEFLTLSLTDLRPQQELPCLQTTLQDRPDGESHAGIFHHCRKDGSEIWADITAYPLMFEGRPCRMVTAVDVTERHMAEEALRQNHALLQGVIEGIGEALYVKDLAGRYRLISSAGAQAIGLPVNAILGRTDEALFPPQTARQTRANDERILSTGRTETYEDTELDGDRTFLSRKGVYRDSGGEVAGIFSVSYDITAQKRAEDALRDRERQMQVIANNVPAMIARIDAQERYLFCNAVYQGMVGLPPEEIIGRSLADVLGPSAYRIIHPFVRRVLAGEAVTYEASIPFPLCGPRFMQVSYTPEPDSAGGVCGFVLSATNITERQQAEDRYRSIFENAVEGIFQSVPGGGFLSVNPALARMLGYATPTELIDSVQDLGTQVYTNPEEREVMRYLFETCSVVSGQELQVLRKDGTTIWASLSARAVRNPDTGDILYIEGSAIDITERRRSEEALQRSVSLLKAQQEAAIDGILIADENHRIVGYNQRFLELWRVPDALAESEDQDPFLAHVTAQMQDPGEFLNKVLYLYEHPDERSRDELALRDGRVFDRYSGPVRSPDGQNFGRVWSFRNITERKSLEAERERLLHEALERADKDPLTGLLNHRAFHKRLDEECERAEGVAHGTPVAVVMMDLDNFKFFNDAYGHPAGDGVLRRVAETLSACARPGDTVARFGGDEFALILPGMDADGAADLVRRICDRTESAGYRPEGSSVAIPLALSAGIAVWPHDHSARLEVVEHADERLRRSKTGTDDRCADDIRTQMGRSLEGFSMLDALVTAVDNKDRYTRKHSEDVLAYSLLIAEGLGLGEAARRTIAVAALLHDVGKIGIPDKVLRKPGRLSEEEFAAVRTHPMMGAIIVGAVPGLEGTLEAIRHHHERWDGGGYPFGLRGEETPLAARLMAVADAFSAMTTDRPYRKGMGAGEARAILAAGAGTQWDPDCVHAFLRAQDPVVALAA